MLSFFPPESFQLLKDIENKIWHFYIVFGKFFKSISI